MTKFVFMIEDEIFQWENLQFHDKNGSDFDSLFKEIVSKATLDVLQTQWSFELYATGNAHLSLTFPQKSLLKKLIMAKLGSEHQYLIRKDLIICQAGLRTSIVNCKRIDHGQAGVRTSIVECVEQYHPGVFITLTVLPRK
ncbi:hypothetical protein P3S67_012403 [Capsicum chacoense]